ncbi:MAG: protein kinase, partial [Acidobacteriota bacterium]
MVSFASESASSPADFKIGEWWVRPQRHVLERLDASHPIELRSMDVLVCLARHAPDVVSKQRLFDEVWADSPYVGDDVISHAIWELRKVLGCSARDPTYIRTVPRRGYQLLAEVLRPQGSPLPLEGVRIDHYDIGPELGRGAMGVVFEATDRRLDRPVAVKFLAEDLTRDPKAVKRFEREARLAASLEHPNLATVHEVGETSRGHRYLVSSLYRGGSLKDRLEAGPLELDEALGYARQLLSGLAAAHAQNVVHRDIKPANLLLDDHGTLKICDFGIAKLLGATDLTRTGHSVGTPAYKSPEQSRGLTVDHRTDLWSAGVVLFELLTGRRPFAVEFDAGVVDQIASGADVPEEVARLPAWLREFLGKALARDPEDRFQDAASMLETFDERLEVRGLEPLPPPSGPWPSRKRRQRLLIAVGAVVLLTTAALLAAEALRNRVS